MDVGVVFKERTKDQGKDDAAQFVREYRVGMEVVVRILHVYADDRAIFPVRGGVHEHDAAPPPWWRDSVGQQNPASGPPVGVNEPSV